MLLNWFGNIKKFNFKEFLATTKGVFLLVHFFIFLFFILIIQNFFVQAEKEYIFNQENEKLYQIKREVEDLKTQNNFLYTENFKEIQAKELNYKRQGETVFNTFSLEYEEKKTYYKPENISIYGFNNFEIWINCFLQPSDICLK